MRRQRGFIAMTGRGDPWDAFTVGAPSFLGGPAGVGVTFGRRITVQPWEAGLLFRDGELLEQLDPGSLRIWRSRCVLATVDLRPRIVLIPTQEIPTADGVPVKVTAAARCRVVDAEAHVSASQAPDEALYLAVQVALRETISTVSVDQLLEDRASLPDQLLAAVRGAAELGLEVDSVELKDIVLPAELKRARAEILVARAEGLAALERSRGETAALRGLANAARLVTESPTLLQLRLLQQLSASTGHTVVIGTDALGIPAGPGDAPSN